MDCSVCRGFLSSCASLWCLNSLFELHPIVWHRFIALSRVRSFKVLNSSIGIVGVTLVFCSDGVFKNIFVALPNVTFLLVLGLGSSLCPIL